MTQVEFFEVRGARWQLALCARVEQAVAAGQRIDLLADGETGARHFDDLLWTFRDDSFVPHTLWQGETAVTEPVAVGWREGNTNRAHILVLARATAAERVDGFARVIDLAPVDLPDLHDARARFRDFQSRGLQPTFHRATPSP